MFPSKIYIRYTISLIARRNTKLGNIRTETRSWRPKWPIIGHYFLICVISGKPDQIATIEQNVQFQVGIYHEKFQQFFHVFEFKPFSSSNFLDYNVIHSTFFYVSLQNAYQISIPLIARMSLKLGKIRTETRSWRPKWSIIGHYFFNMRNIWKTGPDS